jgi:hypothetical protein
MRKVITDIQQKQEKEAAEKLAQQYNTIQQTIEAKLQNLDLKQQIIDAVEKKVYTIYLLTLDGTIDTNLFPSCKCYYQSSHDENSCDYVKFIAKTINDTLDKQHFDIKIKYFGRFDGKNMKIYMEFSL